MAGNRKKQQRRHSLSLERLPRVELGTSDLSVIVKRDGKHLGRLLISIGALEWQPKRQAKYRLVRWKDFDKLMLENGQKVKRRTNPRGRRKKRATKK